MDSQFQLQTQAQGQISFAQQLPVFDPEEFMELDDAENAFDTSQYDATVHPGMFRQSSYTEPPPV